MKKYYIVYDGEDEQIHQNVGGSAYIMVFSGTHEECLQYVKENKIDVNDIGFGK